MTSHADEPVSRETVHSPPARAAAVSRETIHRLDAFLALLARWNPRINLVAPGELPRLRARHIEDALQLLPLVPAGTQAFADLGSGAGFPGLVLAAAAGLPVTLVESDARKAAFLREAARTLEVAATVLNRRIEAVPPLGATLLTARALAPLPRLLALAAPHLAAGGTCLFPKGAGLPAELTAARREWHMQAMPIPSRTDPLGAILVVTDLRPAGPPHA